MITLAKQFKPMWDLKQAAEGEDVLELYIYGDVTDLDIDWENWCYVKSENSANHFREELGKHPNAKQINIYINSYGGSVFEGTAIYNQLKRHLANKTAYIDGFACSIASVIAMAADKVVMPKNAMMMIHNAWMVAIGNSTDLRKAADDLEKINKGNRQAYLMKVGEKLTEEKLIELLDAESWLTAEDCIAYGLADEYADQEADMSEATESLQKMNLNLTQRIQLNKSLAAQLREMTQEQSKPVFQVEPEIPAQPESHVDPEPALPEQNKVLNLFAAFSAEKGSDKHV